MGRRTTAEREREGERESGKCPHSASFFPHSLKPSWRLLSPHCGTTWKILRALWCVAWVQRWNSRACQCCGGFHNWRDSWSSRAWVNLKISASRQLPTRLNWKFWRKEVLQEWDRPRPCTTSKGFRSVRKTQVAALPPSHPRFANVPRESEFGRGSSPSLDVGKRASDIATWGWGWGLGSS